MLAVVVTTLLVASCADDDNAATTTPGPTGGTTVGTVAPQSLTLAQAQLLASMRAANYRLGQASFSTTIDDSGLAVRFHGVVDWHQHVGSAVFAVAGSTDPAASGLVQWNFDVVAAHAGGAVDGPPPTPPADGWTRRALDPSLSVPDTAFALLLSLASPQPDNPQLLQQSDASYLGTEIIAGRTATVFTGPTSEAAIDPSAPTTATADGGSSLTYWVANDGTLLRLQAELGSQPVTVDFAVAPDPPTEFLPSLLPAS